MVGDANGAILAYDALCLNHNLDDTTSLYGEGNRSNDFRHVRIICLFVYVQKEDYHGHLL